MPKISVIIPCCNVEKYIGQCLDSIIGQTLTDFEIICVDDGSTDDTLNIINGYAEKDGRIKVLQQKNQYAGVARNNGMAVAQGEFMIFLDSDDFFDPRMLELSYNAATENNADVVVFGFRRFDDKKQELNEKDELPRKDLLPEAEVFSARDIPEDIFRFTSPAPWTKLFRRSFVEGTGLKFQPMPNSNDFFFILAALSLAERICTVQEALAFYRVNVASSIQGKKHKNPTCFLSAIEALYEHLQKNNLYNIFEKAFQVIALSSSQYNLRSSATDEARYAILEALGNEEGPIFKLLGHENEYYTNNATLKHANLIYNAVSQYNTMKSTKHKADTKPVVAYRGQGDIGVSVVIPVFNTGDYLHETIASICNQTLRGIEIICINDGSTDNSLEILKQWAEKDERISVWTQENAGLSCTRNSGIELAKGKYVYFMDSDDILEKDALETLYGKASEENLDVIFFDADVFYDEPELKDSSPSFNYRRGRSYDSVYSGQDLFTELYNNKEYFPSACLYMSRREYLTENGMKFHPGIIHEDNAFTFAAIINAEKVSHVNKAFFLRRVRGNSIMTATVSFKNAYGYFVAYQDMVRAYTKAEPFLSEDNKSAAMSRVAQNLVNAQTSYANMAKEEIGREYGMGADMRAFERLVVRAGNAYRQCNELKAKNEKLLSQRNGLNERHKALNEKHKALSERHKTLNQKHKDLNENHKRLKVKYRKVNKKYRKVSKKKGKKSAKQTRLQRFIMCCQDHSFSYAVKLSFQRLRNKLFGEPK